MFMLGSDSFYVTAENHEDAVAKAKARIKREDWYSQNGWNVFQELAPFEDENNG